MQIIPMYNNFEASTSLPLDTHNVLSNTPPTLHIITTSCLLNAHQDVQYCNYWNSS